MKSALDKLTQLAKGLGEVTRTDGTSVNMQSPTAVNQAKQATRLRQQKIRVNSPSAAMPKSMKGKEEKSKSATKSVKLTVPGVFAKGDFIDKYYKGKRCAGCNEKLGSHNADVHSTSYGEQHHDGPLCKPCHKDIGASDARNERVPGSDSYSDARGM